MRFVKRTSGDLCLLILGAFLYTLSSPPYEWASAAWVALTPFFLVLHGKTPKAGFVSGLLFGTLFCSGIAHWVYTAIATYFPFHFPLDLVFTFLSYGFFVGTYTGCAAALSCVLLRRSSPLLCRLGIPALWVLGEFARSILFFGWASGARASFTHSEQPATILPVIVTSPMQGNCEEHTPQPGDTP